MNNKKFWAVMLITCLVVTFAFSTYANRSYHHIQLRLVRKQRLGCHQVARALLLFTWSIVGGVFYIKKQLVLHCSS